MIVLLQARPTGPGDASPVTDEFSGCAALQLRKGAIVDLHFVAPTAFMRGSARRDPMTLVRVLSQKHVVSAALVFARADMAKL